MEAKISNKVSKDELIDILYSIAQGDEATDENPIRPTDRIKAIEVISKMLGYFEPEKQEIKTEYVFEL